MNRIYYTFILFILLTIAFSQPRDPEEYAEWKNNLSPDSKSTMLLGPIQNDYVAVQANEDIIFDDGLGVFNIGTSSHYFRPNETLIYAYPSDPSTSHTNFKVDGVYYTNSTIVGATTLSTFATGHAFAVRLDTVIQVWEPLSASFVDDTTDYITGGWMVGDVLIIQNLIPVHMFGDVYTTIDWAGPGAVPPESLFVPGFLESHLTTGVDTTGCILIQYIIENPDASAHDVGVMLEMDTMIGSNDAAPLATSYGYAAVEQDFLLTDVMPDVWYAGENDPPWGPSTLVAQGWLTGFEAVSPDRFLVGQWGTYNSICWDYTPTFGPYGDSAVMIYWYPRTIPPGGDLTIGTYYGLKLPEREKPFAYIVYPPPGIISACPGQEIRVLCRDDLGVDTTNFAVSINGHILVYPEYMTASWSGTEMDSIMFTINPPAGYYSSGDTFEIVVFVRDFFENISDPDTIIISADLVGPEVTSYSISPGDTLMPEDPIQFTAVDDYTGIDSVSILVAVVGDRTGVHTFEVGDGAVTYNSITGDINFDPVAQGFYYIYDDSLIFGLARCEDSTVEEFCGSNHVQDNGIHFFTPDDDTIAPVILDYSPHFAVDGVPFSIDIVLHDEAGVDTCTPSWIYDGSALFPAYMDPYILWDDDGEVDIDYEGRLDLIAIDETTFTTGPAGEIPGYPGGSWITFKVYGYDNDFDRDRIEDALPITDNLQMIPVTEAPTAVLVSPPESSITSCEDQVILIQIECSTGVELDSIALNINGTVYTLDSAALIYDDVSGMLEFNPSGASVFSNGVITINLLPLYDIYETPGMEYIWYIFGDFTPPAISDIVPVPGDEIADLAFDVEFILEDTGLVAEAIAGLDDGSVQVEVTNSDGTFEVTSYVSQTLIAPAYSFTFNTDSAGLFFLDGETVTIRVRAGDLNEVNEYCGHGPNYLDTSWTYTMSETPCQRGPNPITPNGDAYNDSTVFHFPNMRCGKLGKKIHIYDRYQHPVRTLEEGSGWIWNGRDDNGNLVNQGVYIYIIVVDNKAVCNGTIAVAM